MVTIKHIETFVAVADLGTFRRAADRLNTTQPNVSNRIAQLEQQLGVSLMERDAGSVRLTAKGQGLLGPGREVLAALDGFVAAAGDDTLFTGAMRLGVSEMVAHTWLRAFLVEMKQRFPHIDVELTVDLSANLSRALFARELDLVFQNGPFDRKARDSLALGSSPYAWVAAPTLGLGSGFVSTDEILRHPILTHARGTVPFLQMETYFRGLGAVARLVPCSNIGACLQMAIDGLGVACLPDAMLTRYLEEGALVRFDHDGLPDALRFAARSNLDPLPTYIREAAQIAQRLSPPAPEDNQDN